MKVKGHLVDIHSRDIYPVVISIKGSKIECVEKTESVPGIYIVPGLIDAHIHI